MNEKMNEMMVREVRKMDQKMDEKMDKKMHEMMVSKLAETVGVLIGRRIALLPRPTLQLCWSRQIIQDDTTTPDSTADNPVEQHHSTINNPRVHRHPALSNPRALFRLESASQDLHRGLQALDLGTQSLPLPLRGAILPSDYVELGVAHGRDELWSKHLQRALAAV